MSIKVHEGSNNERVVVIVVPDERIVGQEKLSCRLGYPVSHLHCRRAGCDGKHYE